MKNAKCKMKKTRRSASKRCGLAFFILHSAFCILPSSAQTTQPTLSASLGFNGVFKPSSWSPVYVTIAEPQGQSGTIEVRTARGRVGNVVTARVQSNAKPTTFSLYAPLDPLDRITADWRDAEGKLIQHLDLTEAARQNPAALGGSVVGVAGQIADANRVATQLIRDTGEFVAAGAVEARLLPERAIGYDSIDVLVLPELNTDAIEDAVENEILSWVRAGGIVVTWPGAQPTLADSPLARALPVEMGDIATQTIDGRETAIRQMKPVDAGAIDLSDSRTILFARNVGLGHVAVFGFDPTMVYRSTQDRIDAFRKATAKQVALSPDERRTGVYDPLIWQARGEEQLQPAERDSDTWLWIALGIGLVIGPGEALLLLLCRRQTHRWLTTAGCAVALGSGLALLLKPDEQPQRSIELIIETDEGVVARSVLSTSAPTSAAAWLIGRSADPLNEAAGELTLRQRQEHLEPAELHSLSRESPRVRSVDLAGGKPLLLVNGPIDGPSTQVQSADESAWERAVVLSAGGLRALSNAPKAGEALLVANHLQSPTASDDPATVRKETAIEALANQEGWEPILIDRHLGSSLVRRFETEGVSAIVAQRTLGNTKQYVIHFQRR